MTANPLRSDSKGNWVPAVARRPPMSGPLTAHSPPMWFPGSLGTARWGPVDLARGAYRAPHRAATRANL
ncbi:uncharacterized protein N7518_007835 [Penicillium psychrosexuale]|uniref:uncharacterized protein n=1 Tax=Penicillium psychrosexuale TaxID=1002107 RepID=UPI002544EF97|nr:uncharacterized protein N7518_007835 [Penicillium psychrosexuale]KAJ5790824.1 hypothetical protein N7518_007835 [Penicillium psychrosexuale]